MSNSKCPLCGQYHSSRSAAVAAHENGTGAGSDAFQNAAVYGGPLYKALGRTPQAYNETLREHNAFLNYLAELSNRKQNT